MIAEKCVICKEDVEEEYGKLKGTIIKALENKKNNLIYVCSECQKDPKYIETAKVKAA